MKEKLYTIPVNDAFDKAGECPLCNMIQELEEKAVDFTLGPSYMEDDVRGETSQYGFCDKHIEVLYKNQNRLGLSLILKSHMDKIIDDIEKLSAGGAKQTVSSLFRRQNDTYPVVDYIDKLNSSCYICSKIERTFERYVATIFYLYQHDEEFRLKFESCQGFCSRHYGILYKEAHKHLSGSRLNDFIIKLNSLYLNNMKRVRDDLEWFINKFDYRYANEPWKNSRDALPRAIVKANSINLN